AFIPEVIGPVGPIDGFSMILYTPAHSSPSVSTLSQLIASGYPLDRITQETTDLLQAVGRCWHSIDRLLSSIVSKVIPELFRELLNIGGRKDRFGALSERIAELDLPDREKHLLIFRPGANIEMPNPFSYITDPNFWSATRRIICPRTSTHGDLHGGNI